MASLLVITGPPGAGKSTVAGMVARRRNPSVLIEGDAFFAFLDQGAIAPWLPESHAQNDVVVRAAAAAAGRFAATYTAIYDGVIGPWFLPTFAEETGLETLHYVILLPSIEECVERVLTRGKSPAPVGATTIRARYRRVPRARSSTSGCGSVMSQATAAFHSCDGRPFLLVR